MTQVAWAKHLSEKKFSVSFNNRSSDIVNYARNKQKTSFANERGSPGESRKVRSPFCHKTPVGNPVNPIFRNSMKIIWVDVASNNS